MTDKDRKITATHRPGSKAHGKQRPLPEESLKITPEAYLKRFWRERQERRTR